MKHNQFYNYLILEALFLKKNYMLTENSSPPLPIHLGTSSEPTFTNLYYFWLDLSYQNHLFILLFLFLLQFFNEHFFYKWTFLILTIFAFYFSGLNDFFLINYTIIYSDFTNFPNNIFLTNSLNKYHPLIFYSSLIMIIFFFWQNSVKISIKKKFIKISKIFFSFRHEKK